MQRNRIHNQSVNMYKISPHLSLRQRRSSLVTSQRTSLSMKSSSTNCQTQTETTKTWHESYVYLLKETSNSESFCNRGKDVFRVICFTLSIVSESAAPCSFSQSVSFLSGSGCVAMLNMEGADGVSVEGKGRM